ncbi:MAG: sugar isomerase domain-containing protein [Spirochaetia bacterium]|nr:sugar isomerase domain-containing protein [Spirochaetia bacterium]MCF7945574.1 sugar isomerase domain-containing protein [Spirochaetia bacterium]
MAVSFIEGIQSILDNIVSENNKSIKKAVNICADTIQAGRIVNLFGAGHSALPCMEAFPRIGSFVGFHQITEPVLGFNGFVIGKGGQRQMSFIEQTSGLAEVIFENYRFTAEDTLIVFSHSGINALPIELAEEAQKIGMSVIAVMSLSHAHTQKPKPPMNKRLDDAVSCVIDTCVPAHDAIVEIGDGELSGGASTAAALIIMNTLVSETAKLLKRRGFQLTMYPSHNVSDHIDDMLQREKKVFEDYKKLIAKL